MSARGHSSGNDSGVVMHSEFMAFAVDEDSVNLLRGWAGRQGFPAATVQQGGPDLFAQMLEQAAPPKFSILDIDGQADPAGAISRLISLCGPDSKIAALGSANDVTLYRQMIAAGAIDYLVKPLSLETVNQVMTLALRGGTAGRLETTEAKIIVVIGTRGGVGATTIAVNTAWLMAHNLKFNCALIDLDLQFGTSALSLDLDPGRGFRDIISSPQRVDGLMIASSLVPESDQLMVLGAEEAVDEFLAVDSMAITALLKEMRTNFNHIIIDMPRHLLAGQKRLLTAANEIVLITELSLAGIRDTLRIKSAINAVGCSAAITLVASRADGGRINQVDVGTFEKSSQSKIDFVIPEDDKAVAFATNKGKSLGEVAPVVPMTRALLALAKRLSGKGEDTDKKQGGSSLGKLTGFSKKPAPKTSPKS
jgi:pilus assembly protein CpaE